MIKESTITPKLIIIPEPKSLAQKQGAMTNGKALLSLQKSARPGKQISRGIRGPLVSHDVAVSTLLYLLVKYKCSVY